MMTVQQLADWTIRATHIRQNSWNRFARKYETCEIQALTKTQPTIATCGYSANEGEMHIATLLMFVCPAREIREIADRCWEPTAVEPVANPNVDAGADVIIHWAPPVHTPIVDAGDEEGFDTRPATNVGAATREFPAGFEGFWADIEHENATIEEGFENLGANIFNDVLTPPQANTEA